MLSKSHISAIVMLVVAVWAATLWIKGIPFTWDDAWPLTAPFSIAVSTVYGSIILFDKLLWRIPWWRPWFIRRPVLAGTWKATLLSNYVDQTTGKKVPPIEGFWVVRQNFSSISIRLFTKKSASFSLVAEIVERQAGLLSKRPAMAVVRDQSTEGAASASLSRRFQGKSSATLLTG